MEFSIKEYLEYQEEEVLYLYESVEWSNYTSCPDMLQQAFQHSLKVYGAYVQEKLIGVVRIVGDGHSVILFQDILILPDYQHLGVGTALVKHALKEYEDVYQKLLFTEETTKTIEFYKSLGFHMATEFGCCGFMK